MKKRIFYFGLFFILLGNFLNAQGLVVIKDNKEVIDVAKNSYFLADSTNKLIFKDVLKNELQSKFVLNTKQNYSFLNKENSIWIKFSIQNISQRELILKLEDLNIPNFEVYIPEGNPVIYKAKQFGNTLPFDSKEVSTNFYLISLLQAQDTSVRTFYIRFIRQMPRQILLNVGIAKYFMEKDHKRDLFYGAFLGIMSIMALYNFFIYLILKDKTYLYYVLHIIITSLTTLTFTGYSFNLFWYNYPQMNEYSLIFVIGVPLCFLILFTMSFLNTAKYTPLAHKGLYVFLALFVTNTLVTVFNTGLGIIMNQLSALILCAYLISLSSYIYYKGNKAARFYILANGSFMLGVITIILTYSGAIPLNLITENSNQIGTVLEVLFFSFALADRIKVLTKDKEESQKENLRLIEEQKETLEEKVQKRTSELQSANAEILTQNEELQQQQEELSVTNETLETTFKHLQNTSNRLNKSIQYANRIQQVILPKKDKINVFFKEHFVLYSPKDIVSGDFYWFTMLNDSKAIFVLADCTGHGVPGAFMSMIGNTLLHEITKTKGISSPAEILLELHHGIRNVLKQEENQNTDGMDTSVCLFEKEVNQAGYKATFAGAKSGIFYTQDKQIVQLDGDRISIGGFTERKRIFTNQTFRLNENDIIYFTSDGYIDQNDIARKRFGSSKFRELLSSICRLPIPMQEKAIIDSLKEHQQDEEQRDDISVVGIRL